MKPIKKHFLTMTLVFLTFFCLLNASLFPVEVYHNVAAANLTNETEIISQTEPEILEDLQHANDEQLDYWAEHLESFDGRKFGYITPARNQYNKNTCWAFAAVGAVEANILRKGIDENATKDNLDLDETIVAYNRHTRDGSHDPLLLTTNDKYNYGQWNQGDSGAVNAFSIMTQGYTLLDENSFHPSVSEDEIKSKLKQSKYYVQSYQSISAEKNEIKRAILKYGAVAFNYCAPTSNQFYSLKSANHTSIIIGWDDNVKSSGFTPLQPDIDGAWIIRNSWGNYAGYNEINGTWCYYISYALPIGGLYTVDLAMSKDYQNIYHYDGDVTISLNKKAGEAQAAVYEAKLSSPTKQEQLKAVMIHVPQDDLNVNIKIYKNLKVNPGNVNDPMNVPDQNTNVMEIQTHLERSGMQTIDLEKAIDLEQGEYFSIVVNCKTKANVSVPVNCAMDSSASINDMTYYFQDGKWISFKNSNSYADSSTDNRTAKIRAITNTIDRETVLDNDLKYARVEIENRLVYYAKDQQLVPKLNVYLDEKLLQQDQDYSLEVQEMNRPGKTAITIVGKGSYKGSRTTYFEIAKATNPPVFINDTMNVYNDIIYLRDIAIPTDWKWVEENTKLEIGMNLVSLIYVGQDKDFYQNLICEIYVNKMNQNPPATIDISSSKIEIIGDYVYTGEPILPNVKVIHDNIELRCNIDYTLAFQNNIAAGIATLIVTGNGRYFNQITQTFVIQKAQWPKEIPNDIIHVNAKIKNLNQISLDCSNWAWKTPNLELTSDYFQTIAVYTGQDINNYSNTQMRITIIREALLDIASISELKLDTTSFVYDGQEKKPIVIAKDGEKTLSLNIDFDVEYLNNKDAGNASVIVKGKNDYTGSKTLYFTISKAKMPIVETTIHCNKKVTKLSDISLPEGFVWENEKMEITGNRITAKAIYIGEDANNYETIELTFEIFIEQQNLSKNSLKKENWIWIGIGTVGVVLVLLWGGLSFIKHKHHQK